MHSAFQDDENAKIVKHNVLMTDPNQLKSEDFALGQSNHNF
jgi:hypothetical protein